MPRFALAVTAAIIIACALPAPSFAWSKTEAVAYAEAYALSPNPAWPYFAGVDCTNFISQALNHGGIRMDTTRTDRSQWYLAKNINGVWVWGYPWTVARSMYTYFGRDSGMADSRYFISAYDWNSSTTYPTPPNNNTALNKADLVSYDFDLSAGEGIDHTSIVTYNGTDAYNSNYSGDLVCCHSTNRKRIIWHLKHRLSAGQIADTRIYAWGLDSTLN